MNPMRSGQFRIGFVSKQGKRYGSPFQKPDFTFVAQSSANNVDIGLFWDPV